MTGEERRIALLHTIREAKTPISGTALAKKYQVSRQIIVQDIALLRTQHAEIQATPRGYVIFNSPSAKEDVNNQQSMAHNTIHNQPTTPVTPSGVYRRVLCVSHTDEQIEDELNAIVDIGGQVLDVFVKHELYGSIRADLSIKCRRHVQEFMDGISSGKSMPLKNLTSSIHYHTVEAESEEILDMIADALKQKGYLIPEI